MKVGTLVQNRAEDYARWAELPLFFAPVGHDDVLMEKSEKVYYRKRPKTACFGYHVAVFRLPKHGTEPAQGRCSGSATQF